jgi:chromosome segregation ATPase
MSPSEYQELVEFLTGQFGQIDRQFHDLTLQIDRRFTVLDRRFEAFQAEVDERFREVFGHFEEIYRRLERLEQEYYAISQQLRRIEAALTDESGRREILERDLAVLKEHVGLLQARISEIERRLGS